MFEVFSNYTLRRSNGRPALLACGGDVEDELADSGFVRNHHNSLGINTTVVGGFVDGGVGRTVPLKSLNTPISLCVGVLSSFFDNSTPNRMSRPCDLSTLLCESHEAIHEEHEKRK